MKTGTKETQDLIKFAAVLAVAIHNANADGKFSVITDTRHFFPVVEPAKEAITGLENVTKEMLDMDPVEWDALMVEMQKLMGPFISTDLAQQITLGAVLMSKGAVQIFAAIRDHKAANPQSIASLTPLLSFMQEPTPAPVADAAAGL